MAWNNVKQPDMIVISDTLRLRKYDGNYEQFLLGYQDPFVYRNSEGIFDDSKKPNLEYVQRMCGYLSEVGEMYYIEVEENGVFIPVGDVTVKPENPPIALWVDRYRGRGIGYAVMQTVIARLKELGCRKITGTTVYKWNTASQRLHEKLGFQRVGEEDDEYTYELLL